MDAGEQAAVAELLVVEARGEAATQHVAARLEHREAAADVAEVERDALGEGGGGHRAEGLAVAAQQQHARVFAVRDGDARCFRDVDDGDYGVWVEQPGERDLLRGEPERLAVVAEAGGPVGLGERFEPWQPAEHVRFADRDEAEQRVVHLLGVARDWARPPRARARWRPGRARRARGLRSGRARRRVTARVRRSSSGASSR